MCSNLFRSLVGQWAAEVPESSGDIRVPYLRKLPFVAAVALPGQPWLAQDHCKGPVLSSSSSSSTILTGSGDFVIIGVISKVTTVITTYNPN